MKKAIKFLCVVLMITLSLPIFACDFTDKPKKPITGIQINDSEITMYVGESKYFNYTVTPSNTDEKVKFSSNTNIVEVVNGRLIARSAGSTYVTINAELTKGRSASVKVNVVKPFDFSEFESNYSYNLKRATLSVYCKRYNLNFWGKEKDVNIVSGKGVVVRSDFNSKYFLTDKTIFDKVETKYSYEEWYVIDYNGEKYSITGMKYDKNTSIGIGTFSSKTSYPIAKISKKDPIEGEYVVSIFGDPYSSRISSYQYSVFYHKSGVGSKSRGEAVYNADGEIIGVNMKFSSSTATAVSSYVILKLYNAIFNPDSIQGGGTVDIVGGVG